MTQDETVEILASAIPRRAAPLCHGSQESGEFMSILPYPRS